MQNVGLALRDMLSKVDQSLSELPQETHTEVRLFVSFFLSVVCLFVSFSLPLFFAVMLVT